MINSENIEQTHEIVSRPFEGSGDQSIDFIDTQQILNPLQSRRRCRNNSFKIGFVCIFRQQSTVNIHVSTCISVHWTLHCCLFVCVFVCAPVNLQHARARMCCMCFIIHVGHVSPYIRCVYAKRWLYECVIKTECATCASIPQIHIQQYIQQYLCAAVPFELCARARPSYLCYVHCALCSVLWLCAFAVHVDCHRVFVPEPKSMNEWNYSHSPKMLLFIIAVATSHQWANRYEYLSSNQLFVCFSGVITIRAFLFSGSTKIYVLHIQTSL